MANSFKCLQMMAYMTLSFILKSFLKVKLKNQAYRKTFQQSKFKACIVIQAIVTSKYKQQTFTNQVKSWDSHLLQTRVSKAQNKKFIDMCTNASSHLNLMIMRNLPRQAGETIHVMFQRSMRKVNRKPLYNRLAVPTPKVIQFHRS